MPKDLFIAIAVSRPDGLDVVEGALPSAHRFVAWARAHGYDTELVADDAEPVTCARLQKVFADKLGDGGQQRIVISFAGHGVIRDAGEEYWLLNDWRTRSTEAVNHYKLRSRLGTYLPRQIAIISDACRLLVSEKAKWVEGNGIVTIKDYVEKTIEVANLSGTRAAQPSYATPIGASDAYCFFSHVLVNALCGLYPDAIEQDAKLGKVVSQDRMYTAVERELPLLASRYKRNQSPELSAGWRTPNTVWSVLSRLLQDTVPSFKTPPLPEPSFGLDAETQISVIRDERSRSAMKALEAQVVAEIRATHFETGTGLAVANGQVIEVATAPNMPNQRDQIPQWFRIHPREGKATPVLAKLDDGTWCGAAVYSGFIGTFSMGQYGAHSFLLRPNWMDQTIATGPVAAAATGGTLGDPYDLAAELRDQKHTEPVLGALAAYAYARAGAVDEIRRLTSFYFKHNQPAPFDAVLLARVPIERDGDGLIATIPAVREREPRSAKEQGRPFTYEATPAVVVRVAGAFPWLRQGWSLLEDDFRPQFRRLAKFADHLRPSLFTTLKSEAGDELAALVRRGEI